MTYILGARCRDGVVLIGDKKTLRGSIPSEHDKLIQIFPNVIMGGAGTRGIVERFSDEIKNKVTNGEINNDKELLDFAEDRTLELHRRYYYRTGGLDIIYGIRSGNESELFNIVTSSGVAEPVKEYTAIGSGEPYGAFLVKEFWNKEMTMLDFARLAYFVINYIIKFKLDDSVGGDPQVWFMPDIILEENIPREETMRKYPIRQAKQHEIEDMKNFSDKKLDRMIEFLKELNGKATISSASK